MFKSSKSSLNLFDSAVQMSEEAPGFFQHKLINEHIPEKLDTEFCHAHGDADTPNREIIFSLHQENTRALNLSINQCIFWYLNR